MESTHPPLRARIKKIVTNDQVVIVLILSMVVLTYFNSGLGFLLGILAVLISLWSTRWDCSYVGISRPQWGRAALWAAGYSIGIFVIVDILIQPLVEISFGEIDLSNFENIKGNLASYLIFIAFMWVVAGFGEEFVYRGFVVNRLAHILGGNPNGWLIAILLSSVAFGLAHMYQGISGVIATGLVGALMGLIFMRHKQSLSVTILTHGFYDMIGITLIYWGQERIIVDWVRSLIS